MAKKKTETEKTDSAKSLMDCVKMLQSMSARVVVNRHLRGDGSAFYRVSVKEPFWFDVDE